MKILIASLFLLVNHGQAEHKKGHAHGAHEHGVAKLQIAVEGNKATLVLESPADSIYGFEYEPKTAAEKAKKENAFALLQTKFQEMVSIDAAWGCTFSNSKMDVEKEEGEHSELHAEWSVQCKKPLAGAKISFAVTKHFPRLKTLRVDVLSDKNQSSHEIKSDKGNVTL